jgi:hypothetical protein
MLKHKILEDLGYKYLKSMYLDYKTYGVVKILTIYI